MNEAEEVQGMGACWDNAMRTTPPLFLLFPSKQSTSQDKFLLFCDNLNVLPVDLASGCCCTNTLG